MKELNAIFCHAARKAGWDLTWTSFQINHNTVANWHQDSMNKGLSFIAGVGDYSEGLLVLDGFGGFDIQNLLLKFDGRGWHRSTPFKGQRYSVVGFTSTALDNIKEHQWREVRSLGFPVPVRGVPPFRAPPMTHARPPMTPQELYVGRNRRWGDGFWSNPHKHLDRGEAVRAYEEDLRADSSRRALLGGLAGRGLVCHCRQGDPCHTDVLIKVFEEEFPAEPASCDVAAYDELRQECDVVAYDKLRQEYADKDTSDEDGEGRTRLRLGAGRRGRGRPMFYVQGGKKKWFEDGGGLCSPGRWRPEQRDHDPLVAGHRLRDGLLRLLDRHLDVKKLVCAAACNRLVESPLTDTILMQARNLLADFVENAGAPRPSVECPQGHKIRLHLLGAVAKAFGDPDWEVLTEGGDSFLSGVPLGVESPLPRTPAVYERKKAWRKYESQDGPPSSKANYISCEGNARVIREQFLVEEKEGFMRRTSLESLREEYGNNVCVAALGAIEKGDSSFRIIHDATHGVQINPRIVQRDQVRLPGASELKLITRLSSERGKTVFSLSGDISKAHRLPVVRRQDHGYQVCTLGDGEYWINQVGTFRVGSAAYWWSRLAAVGSRVSLYLAGQAWLWQLLYADDYLWLASGASPLHDILLMVLILCTFGFPFAWKKFKGGFQVSWIGFWADLTTWQVGLSDSRADWVVAWLNELLEAEVVPVKRIAEGLGRLGFAVSAADHYKPFLGPWYAWVAACRDQRTTSVPTGLKIIAKFLRDHIEDDKLRADARYMREGDPPIQVCPDFRADARAEGEDVVVGGWLSKDGRQPGDAPWFSVRITRSDFPWIWCRGEPGRNIATLELLGTLLCVVLFAKDFRGTQLSITGVTDNRGNAQALLKMMTTKFPLSAVLMELACWVPEISGGEGLSLLWVPRLQNVEADALSNEHFDGFKPSNRVRVDLKEIPWKVLPKMIAYGADLLAKSEAAKEKSSAEASSASAATPVARSTAVAEVEPRTAGRVAAAAAAGGTRVKRARLQRQQKAGPTLRETDPW